MTEDEPGRVIGSYMGRIVLRDPRSWDVSRAGKAIEPPETPVKDIEAAVKATLAALGYAVTVELTRTDE